MTHLAQHEPKSATLLSGLLSAQDSFGWLQHVCGACCICRVVLPYPHLLALHALAYHLEFGQHPIVTLVPMSPCIRTSLWMASEQMHLLSKPC
jgi:hypothetical protein